MEKVQATLNEILTRFATVGTDIKAVSDEVHSLRKMEEFGDEMDSIKHLVHDNGKLTASPFTITQPTAPPQADKGTAPPLLHTSQQQPAGYHTAPFLAS